MALKSCNTVLCTTPSDGLQYLVFAFYRKKANISDYLAIGWGMSGLVEPWRPLPLLSILAAADYQLICIIY